MCDRKAEFAYMAEDTLSVKKTRASCNKGSSTAGLSVEQDFRKTETFPYLSYYFFKLNMGSLHMV